jgi:ribosomal protein S18 acetylase RimI-like enzyme
VAEIAYRPETARQFAHELIYIHEIGVRPGARRKGIGGLLLDAAKEHAQSLQIPLLTLDTWSFNEDALRFFQKNGLVPVSVRFWNKCE